ncbi:alpha/beta fold hydrolase [Nocardia sp. NPDC004568]|uniref:thioesterase II family protein n=1 Tax=Nocardia sp. NPDC004568 TaxID=3154551 RepID=UPI0033A6CD21
MSIPSGGEQERWLRELQAGHAGQPALVCFPPGGGSATSYRGLAASIGAGPAVYAVQYPGRQNRIAEEFVTSITALADHIAAATEARIPGSPVLFGHSMGATVAFETARRLEARGRTVAALFVSGRPDPTFADRGTLHRGTDADLIDELERLANDPATVTILRDEPALAEMVLPAVRNDYRAVETYRYQEGERLRCDIVALLGRSDPTTTSEQLARWRDHTRGDFAVRLFPGGHFYLDEHERQIADLIAPVLASGGSPRT